MKRFALLIGMLAVLCAAVSAYAGVGYNQQYWYAGQNLGNGVGRFGYGMYDGMSRYGDGAYQWQTTYGSQNDGELLRARYGYGNSARYGKGVVSPRYGRSVISPRYGYGFQSPRGVYREYYGG